MLITSDIYNDEISHSLLKIYDHDAETWQWLKIWVFGKTTVWDSHQKYT